MNKGELRLNSRRDQGLEVATIFRLGSAEYQSNHSLCGRQLKVMQDIQDCRTARLGGHIDGCEACGYLRISYNSCRNSHCPKCQSMAREEWLEKRREELLPVKYFHLVFTLPEELHDLVRYNERLLYGQLFKLAWESLRTLVSDRRYLGAATGMISVLHTWGQNLHYHPHVHCLVPAGGLSKHGKWIKSGKSYLVPVKALSKLFRAKYISYIRQAHRGGLLKLEGPCARWATYPKMNALLNKLYNKNWVVYCKAPFGGAEKLLDYLGRYVKRIAISNDRIVKIDAANKRVAFRWRDYGDNNRSKLMWLSLEEFIRRFLQHILPKRFSKVRYYGLFANRDKTKRLSKCRKALGQPRKLKTIQTTWQERFYRLTGIDPKQCPCCKQGQMHKIAFLTPSRAPPNQNVSIIVCSP